MMLLAFERNIPARDLDVLGRGINGGVAVGLGRGMTIHGQRSRGSHDYSSNACNECISGECKEEQQTQNINEGREAKGSMQRTGNGITSTKSPMRAARNICKEGMVG